MGNADAPEYGPYIKMQMPPAPVAALQSPTAPTVAYRKTIVSYYGCRNTRECPHPDRFYGKRTASGEPLLYRTTDTHPTVAHRSLPFGTLVRFRNPRSGQTVVARVNDRGPFVTHREFDLSLPAAQSLGIIAQGISHVEYSIVGRVATG